MERVKELSWEDVRELLHREVEERLKGRITAYWIDSIKCLQHSEGDLWVARLRVVVRHGLFSKKGYFISAEINPYSREFVKFEAKPAR